MYKTRRLGLDYYSLYFGILFAIAIFSLPLVTTVLNAHQHQAMAQTLKNGTNNNTALSSTGARNLTTTTTKAPAANAPANVTTISPTITPPLQSSLLIPLLGTVLVYAAIVAAFMFIPLLYDMRKVYGHKSSVDDGKPVTEANQTKRGSFPDLARSLMAFGIIIVLAILVFHVLVSVTLNVLPPATNNALVDIIKNLSTILGGAVSAIIGFYFGQKSTENADKKSGTPGG